MDLEFATATRTGKLLEWLRADAARGRHGAPSAEWPHSSLAAFVLAHGRPFAVDDVGSAQRRLARSLAAMHWRVHGPFQHREPALNAQRCLFLMSLRGSSTPRASFGTSGRDTRSRTLGCRWMTTSSTSPLPSRANRHAAANPCSSLALPSTALTSASASAVTTSSAERARPVTSQR
jgi:hypothetical protein